MKRVLEPLPPTPDYKQVGWVCMYHDPSYAWGTGRMACHNPLDCDLVPVWALKREVAIEVINGRQEHPHAQQEEV